MGRFEMLTYLLIQKTLLFIWKVNCWEDTPFIILHSFYSLSVDLSYVICLLSVFPPEDFIIFLPLRELIGANLRIFFCMYREKVKRIYLFLNELLESRTTLLFFEVSCSILIMKIFFRISYNAPSLILRG